MGAEYKSRVYTGGGWREALQSHALFQCLGFFSPEVPAKLIAPFLFSKQNIGGILVSWIKALHANPRPTPDCGPLVLSLPNPFQ